MAVNSTEQEARYARQLAAAQGGSRPAPDAGLPLEPEPVAEDTEQGDETEEQFDPAVAARQLGRAQAQAQLAEREAEAAQEDVAVEDQPQATGVTGNILQREVMRRFVSRAIFQSLRAAIFSLITVIGPFLLYFAIILVFIVVVVYTYYLVTGSIPGFSWFTNR